jgi:hypothetical protein
MEEERYARDQQLPPPPPLNLRGGNSGKGLALITIGRQEIRKGRICPGPRPGYRNLLRVNHRGAMSLVSSATNVDS